MKRSILILAAIFVLSMTSVGMAKHLEEEPPGGVKSLEDRIRELEEALARPVESENWYDRFQFSGLIEVEGQYGRTDFDDPDEDDEKTSDVDLATVELVVDVRVVDHVDGHVMLKYEDDDLFVDEGFITLSGTDAFPAYLIAGKQYLPFGYFDSHFVTDPTTLSLGETNEGAATVGYIFGEDMVAIFAGVYNGRAQESGDDDLIDSYVAGFTAHPLENLMVGASFTSNLASADSFNEEVVDPDNLDSIVAGWSAFIAYQFLDRFQFLGEYLAAFDEFEAGELYDAGDNEERSPAAWNLELGFALTDTVEMAVRYGGSEDGGGFLPEREYGAVLNWAFFENTNLAVEYLHGDFEDDVQETNTITAQLAIAF